MIGGIHNITQLLQKDLFYISAIIGSGNFNTWVPLEQFFEYFDFLIRNLFYKNIFKASISINKTMIFSRNSHQQMLKNSNLSTRQRHYNV